jgi:hypothetical protein
MGQEHSKMMTNKRQLSFILWNQGQQGEAEELLLAVIQTQKQQ